MSFKIHKVLEGPFSILDVYPDYEQEEFFFIETLAESPQGVLGMNTIESNSLDALYEIVKHLKSPTLEPFVLEENPND